MLGQFDNVKGEGAKSYRNNSIFPLNQFKDGVLERV